MKLNEHIYAWNLRFEPSTLYWHEAQLLACFFCANKTRWNQLHSLTLRRRRHKKFVDFHPRYCCLLFCDSHTCNRLCLCLFSVCNYLARAKYSPEITVTKSSYQWHWISLKECVFQASRAHINSEQIKQEYFVNFSAHASFIILPAFDA